MPRATTATASTTTRTRYWVIVFAVTLAIIRYIDRVCISQAAPLISRDLNLSDKQMGWVFSAFTLAYALFEIPASYLSPSDPPCSRTVAADGERVADVLPIFIHIWYEKLR